MVGPLGFECAFAAQRSLAVLAGRGLSAAASKEYLRRGSNLARIHMDYHPPTVSQDCSPTDAEPLLDSVTAELKAEFARLNREAALNELSSGSLATRERVTFNRHSPRGIQRHALYRQVIHLQTTICNSLETTLTSLLSPLFGQAGLRHEIQFWAAALESAIETLAKLSAFFAHSLQATMRTPLLLDGPELSGYKHRLR